PAAENVIEAARSERGVVVTRERDAADSIAAAALASCSPQVCAAVARGELAIGMSYDEALAATRTTGAAWRMRQSGPALVMVPAQTESPPADVVAPVAIVQFRDGRVIGYGYREGTGLRLVNAPEQATPDARATSLAESLLREGDDYVARGD